MQVFVKTLTGLTITIDATTDETVVGLKSKIYDKGGHKVENQIIIFAGKELDDRRCLLDYNIQTGSTVHLVVKLR